MGDMRRSLNDDVERQIVALLTELQGSRTDGEMAALIGCGRVHWWNAKNRRRRLSYALAKRAAAEFPGVMQFLVRDLSEPMERAS